MSIRGIYSTITDIRRQVFTEVARMGYEGGDYSRIEDLPYKIVPGEVAEHRSSIFLERAIVGERLRLAMGLSPRPLDQHAPLAAGAEESARPEKYYEPPLVNILKFACNACPEKRYIVTNLCQNCLAHPCREICPKKAVKLSHRGVSRIQEDLCIRCGKCADVCPYNAIILQERPCAKACGMDAIRSDEHGRADIDYDKCVSCGMCLVNCPFGAISDKSQLFQLTQALRGGEKVIAIVAPAFVGQLGPSMTPDKLKAALKMLLEALRDIGDKFKADYLVNMLVGRNNALIKSYNHHKSEWFGIGDDHNDRFWGAVVRQALILGLVDRNIENYGLLSINEAGEEYIENPYSVMMTCLLYTSPSPRY